MSESGWHCLWVYEGWERRVWRALADLALGPYLPQLRVTAVRRGNVIDERRPRFPGYVFWLAGRYVDGDWHMIHCVRGVGGILADEELRPAIIPEREMTSPLLIDMLDAIRQAAPRDLLFKSRRRLKAEAKFRAHLASLHSQRY